MFPLAAEASGGVFGANTTESKIRTYTAINLDQVTGTFVRQKRHRRLELGCLD